MTVIDVEMTEKKNGLSLKVKEIIEDQRDFKNTIREQTE